MAKSIVVLAIVFFFQAKSADSELSALTSSLSAQGNSIAVLPFEDFGDNPEESYFAEGISEDLIIALSRFQDFHVFGRASTMPFKGQSDAIRKVHSKLGADYALRGSVRKSESIRFHFY